MWCTGCQRDHDETAFYRDARGRPYGPCKEYRRARRRELARLERAALRVLTSTLSKDIRADLRNRAQSSDHPGIRDLLTGRPPAGPAPREALDAG